MARRFVKIPTVKIDGKTGNQIPGSKKLTDPDETNKALAALQEAPEGYRFPFDKLKDFFLGKWSPPRRPREEKKVSPPSPPPQPAVIVRNVSFA